MKLKRYLQFIKESLKEDIEEGKLWRLSEDEIREYLLEITDAGYYVEIQFGFLEKSKQYVYKDGNPVLHERDIFTENVKSGDNVRPCYWIQIDKSKKIKNDDVTAAFQFACSIISEEANAELSVHDRDGDLGNSDGIVIKGGLFYTDDWNSSEPELLEADDYIAIFAKQKDTVKITTKQLVDYYSWNVDIIKNGQFYAEIDLEDLAHKILSKNSNYKDSLVKGQEHMWDYYDISYYFPEINSLFQYDLDKENERLLVKAIIKELGGLEQTINFIGDECDDDIYESVKGLSEQELIEYLLKERFYNTIKQLSKDSEVLIEVRDTVANWEMSAHCDDNYKEIVEEFDSIVDDQLGDFDKVEKEVTKYWTNKDGERKEYKTEVTYYQFPYRNDWIENVDSDYLHGKDLDEVFREWIDEQNLNYELNPRITDYGSVDKAKMNQDIKVFLISYLSK